MSGTRDAQRRAVRPRRGVWLTPVIASCSVMQRSSLRPPTLPEYVFLHFPKGVLRQHARVRRARAAVAVDGLLGSFHKDTEVALRTRGTQA